MTSPPFVPQDFDVPDVLETENFRLRMLSVDDVDKDYEAVMESQEMLLKVTNGRWPREGVNMTAALTRSFSILSATGSPQTGLSVRSSIQTGNNT